MSKSGMLRTRRRDVNIKPNRRLDRKSSRGMIYENEELRLRTININAEIERGQSDIKKLRRENEQLRKEIWCLRDEYDKLDKLLKEKENGESCTSCSSDSESCSSESSENETEQNQTNQKSIHSLRRDFDHLSVVTEETSADLSDRNSAGTNSLPKDPTQWNILPPDDTYPSIGPGVPLQGQIPPDHLQRIDENVEPSRQDIVANIFQGLEEHLQSLTEPRLPQLPEETSEDEKVQKTKNLPNEAEPGNFFAPWPQCNGFSKNLQPCEKGPSDLIVKDSEFPKDSRGSVNSFVNGGNLEELLQDIHTISKDILQISSENVKNDTDISENDKTLHKTELNVVLLPKPMPLLGFEKYDEIQNDIKILKKSSENLQKLDTKNVENISKINENFCMAPYDANMGYSPSPLPPLNLQDTPNSNGNPFIFSENFQNENHDSYDNLGFKNDFLADKNHKMNEIDNSFEANVNNENVEKNGIQKMETDSKNKKTLDKPTKTKKTRKVSIFFKGKKDKLARSLSLDTKNSNKKTDEVPKTPQTPQTPKKETVLQKAESKTSISEPNVTKTDEKILNSDAKNSTDSKTSLDRDKKHSRKSSSTSPERKHHSHDKKGHKKRHKKVPSANERHLSALTRSRSADRQHRDRSFSVCTDRSHILDHRFGDIDFTNSERERTNSLSSCDSIKSRKNSLSNFKVGEKIPWFGCWGNGCI